MADEQASRSPAPQESAPEGGGSAAPRGARAQRGPSRRTVAREQRRRRSEGRRSRRRRIYLLGGSLVALALIAGLVLPSLGGLTTQTTVEQPDGSAPAVGEEVAIQPGGIVEPDAEITYSTSPPTSGPRLETPAPWGVHDEQVPNEALVRNLHVGGIAFNYGAADETALAGLLSFVETLPDYPGCYVAHPYPGVPDGEVTLTAWGWTHTVPLADTAEMEAFVESHRNQGEAYLGPDCTGAAADAAPTPDAASPTPEAASPTPAPDAAATPESAS